jgi:hypothetical protein
VNFFLFKVLKYWLSSKITTSIRTETFSFLKKFYMNSIISANFHVCLKIFLLSKIEVIMTSIMTVLIWWFRFWWFYRFCGRNKTFHRRKTDFNEIKNCHSTVISWLYKWKILSASFLKDPFNTSFRHFSFWITEGIGPAEVSFHFWPREQIPSSSCHMNLWLLFHVHVKYWPILLFLNLIKILCWAQSKRTESYFFL